MTDILIGRHDSTSCQPRSALRQPPRHGRRRYRHRQISFADGARRGLFAIGRAVLPRRRQGRPGRAGALAAGEPGDKLKARLDKLKLREWKAQANPVIFWDIYGKLGHPVRATISEMGPTLLGRVLELNDTQEGVLEVIFKVADEQGLLLLDLADLRSLLTFAADNAKDISARYGLISKASVAAIQRALLKLENDGANQFFGEPALELTDLMRQDMSGRGIINVLAADQLIMKPRLYSTFLLWLLSELFEQLPEVGDLDQPKMIFFFDEAHLLFDDASPALLQRVEQVVRLIRSKGVGVYFCSQNPDDVPGNILGQLGNRVQHALRAFTPRDQKAVKAAAETFVANPRLDGSVAITQLAVGEALASTLATGGVPTPVEQVLVTAPCCRIGAITEAERTTIRQRSPVGAKYDTTINRESAAEMLAKRADDKAVAAPNAPTDTTDKGATPEAGSAWGGAVHDALFGTNRRQGMIETMGKQMVRTVGSQIGRQILRGVLGGIFGGKR